VTSGRFVRNVTQEIDTMDDPSRPDEHSICLAVPTLRLRAVLGASFRIWRRDIRSLTVLAAGLELPLVVADLALHFTPGLKNLTDGSFTVTVGVVVVLLYGSLSHHFLAGLLERVVAAERHGHSRPTLSEILHDIPWYRLVVADLLLTVLIVVGFAAFVIPGLLVLTWFSIMLPIVNLERDTVPASFARSYRLVRGHSWRVFAITFNALVIPEFLIGAAAALTAHFTDHVVVIAIGHALPAVVLMPIAAVPIVILAFDLVDIDTRRNPAAGKPRD
jgi:hypothetical protein